MAKKKNKPGKAKKQAKRAAPAKRSAKKSTAKRGPRSVPLPGMGRVRHSVLDNVCENIAEYRSAKNRAIQNEAGETPRGMKYMAANGVTLYRHAGVELVFAPGVDHLRVRLIKEQGDDKDAGEKKPKGKRTRNPKPEPEQRDLGEGARDDERTDLGDDAGGDDDGLGDLD